MEAERREERATAWRKEERKEEPGGLMGVNFDLVGESQWSPGSS